jgi:hypothetical protein
MTERYSRSYQQAESAFAKVQSQFLARNRAAGERDLNRLASEEKTSRLRKARLAKEADDRARAMAAVTSKRALEA